MKEQELREHATCSRCKKGIGHTRLPFFWTMKATRWGLDAVAMQRSAGLGMMLGSPALAMVMGPDEDLANEVDSQEITLCETCALDLMAILESCKPGEPRKEPA